MLTSVASPYAANIAPKILVSINIGHRQHDKDSGAIRCSFMPRIIFVLDRNGGPSIRHRRFVLIVVLCVVGFSRQCGDFVFLEFLRRNWYENNAYRILAKETLEPTQ